MGVAAAEQPVAADKGRLVLGHTLLSAVGKAGFGSEALVKVGPLQLIRVFGRPGQEERAWADIHTST